MSKHQLQKLSSLKWIMLALCFVVSPRVSAADALTDLLQKYAPLIQTAEQAKMASPQPNRAPQMKPALRDGYSVQVAAVASEREAQDQVAQFTSRGMNAFYLSALVAGKTWYRINVGFFDNKSSAKDFQKNNQQTAELANGLIKKVSSLNEPDFVAGTKVKTSVYIAETHN